MAAPAYIAAGTKAQATGGTVAPTYMGGISANDLLFALVVSVGNGIITPPSGWTEQNTGTIINPPSAAFKLYIKLANGTERGTVTFTRTGYSGSSTFMAQLYQYRGTAFITVESSAYPTFGGNASTITWNAVTVGGSERTLAAFVINYNGSNPGSPSGYTMNQSDNDGIGTYFELNSKENVSSDGSVTATNGSTNGWTAVHVSIYNMPAPAALKRSFIVN